MPRLRTTLPRDFRPYEPVYTVAELEQLFDRRHLDARGGYGKAPAISHPSVDVDGVRWLLDRGADIEATDTYDSSPLTCRAGWIGSADVVRLLLERGADPNRAGRSSSPLMAAAVKLELETVDLLLAAGANPLATAGYRDVTPLDRAMTQLKAHQAGLGLDLARRLLPLGASVSGETPRYLRRTVSEVQRWAADGTGGARVTAELAALTELLDLLGVEVPAPPRRLADDERITVTAPDRDVTARYRELWDLLVPAGGAAPSVQGEVVRIAGRIGHEVLGNGGGNWDRDFEAMLTAYAVHVRTGAPLDAADLARVDRAVDGLRGGAVDEDAVDTLTELSVRWVLRNPVRVGLEPPVYRR